MAGCMDPDEGEIALAFDLPNLLAVTAKLQRSAPNLFVCFAAGPFKSVSPSDIPEPVANEIGITSIDQDWDSIQDVGD